MRRPHEAFAQYVANTGMFFQYPARTEAAFAQTGRADATYMPIPWATIIDKRYDIDRLRNALASICATLSPRPTSTCCQHIHWRQLLPLLTSLGIRTLYTPHKLLGEDLINGMRIVACPLFAVNVEDPAFAALGREPVGRRDLLYSFVGANASHYISDVRARLFAMAHPVDAVVHSIDAWHLEHVVYSCHQNASGELQADDARDARTAEYNRLLRRSTFALCPSGAGPNTIRFWEALALGAIPVVLSDGMCLPTPTGGDDWSGCLIRIEEARLETLEATLRAIAPEDVERMRSACVRMYDWYGLRAPRASVK